MGIRAAHGQRENHQETDAKPAKNGVIYRRRRADWLSDVDIASGAAPDVHADEQVSAARRAALEMAKATLLARHGFTADHSDDVGLVCEEIADRLGIDGWDRANLMAAAQLHDLGKLAVPQSILDKPGRLTADEWAVVREHTPVGERILMAVPEMQEVARIVRHSHEHFDGSGYPDGLAQEEIPLASRVILCADAFHAVRSDRPYRRGRPADRALDEIRAHAGTQFDPEIVAALEDAARKVGTGRATGAGSPRAVLRSRRLVALLVTLVVSGSAYAAVNGPLAGGEDEAVAGSQEVPCSVASCPLVHYPEPRHEAGRKAARLMGPSAAAAPASERGGNAGERLTVRGALRDSKPARTRRGAAREENGSPRAPDGGRGRAPAGAAPQDAPAAAPAPGGPAAGRAEPRTEQPATRPTQPRPAQPQAAPKPVKPPKQKPAKQKPAGPNPGGNAYGHQNPRNPHYQGGPPGQTKPKDKDKG